MALGPGKYDHLCTIVRQGTNAEGVIVIVIGGDKGDGFSVQAALGVTQALPELLRRLADNIEADLG